MGQKPVKCCEMEGAAATRRKLVVKDSLFSSTNFLRALGGVFFTIPKTEWTAGIETDTSRCQKLANLSATFRLLLDDGLAVVTLLKPEDLAEVHRLPSSLRAVSDDDYIFQVIHFELQSQITTNASGPSSPSPAVTDENKDLLSVRTCLDRDSFGPTSAGEGTADREQCKPVAAPPPPDIEYPAKTSWWRWLHSRGAKPVLGPETSDSEDNSSSGGGDSDAEGQDVEAAVLSTPDAAALRELEELLQDEDAETKAPASATLRRRLRQSLRSEDHGEEDNRLRALLVNLHTTEKDAHTCASRRSALSQTTPKYELPRRSKAPVAEDEFESATEPFEVTDPASEPVLVTLPDEVEPPTWVRRLGNFQADVESGTSDEEDVESPAVRKESKNLPTEWSHFDLGTSSSDEAKEEEPEEACSPAKVADKAPATNRRAKRPPSKESRASPTEEAVASKRPRREMKQQRTSKHEQVPPAATTPSRRAAGKKVAATKSVARSTTRAQGLTPTKGRLRKPTKPLLEEDEEDIL